jgi:hypothetical protein
MDHQMLKKSASVALAVIGAMMSWTPVQAQNTAWRVDSEQSTARLFLASASNPDAAVNVGAARLSGVIHEGAGGSTASRFNFTIHPADKDATPPSQKTSGNDPDYTVIHFKSTRVVPAGTNDFRVTGDLTVTHVERVAALTPNEAYASAAYSPAVTESVTKPVVFQFHRVSPSAAGNVKEDKTEWSASSATVAEDFPELMNVVSTTHWPNVVADVRCAMPSTAGEDFSGEACTETSPVRRANNQVRMELHLQVTRIDATGLAGPPNKTGE